MARSTFTAASVYCIFIGLLTSCVGGGQMVAFDNPGRVWPEPPDMQRIAFVGEFSGSSDLGIKPGVWARMVSLVAGGRDDVMVRPMAVVSAQDDSVIYVADPGARCVHRYDLQRSKYTCLTMHNNQALVSPVGLTLSSDGRLFVSDSRLGAIFQLKVGDKWLEEFTVANELLQPTGIAWDERAQLLVVTDTGTQSIKAFDASGTLVWQFGERGGLPGQVNYPTYSWLDTGSELLLTDSLNFRVQRFAEDGRFISSFGQNGDSAGSFARPKGVATDSYGHVYVVDALSHSIQLFNRDGALLLSIGEQGQEAGQFWLPNGIHISGDNTIYVADSQNRRIQVFRYVGPDA
jgi:sugar lactone lactonase YvrE